MPELFVTPAPAKESETAPLAIIENALAPGLKRTPPTCVTAERETLVVLETPKVATSVGLFGTVLGVQLAAVFHSLLVGLRFQVALPA
jgi:hypothetical protein